MSLSNLNFFCIDTALIDQWIMKKKTDLLVVILFSVIFLIWALLTILFVYFGIKFDIFLINKAKEIVYPLLKIETDPQLITVEYDRYQNDDFWFSINYQTSWYYFSLDQPYDKLSDASFVIFSSTLGNTSIQDASEDEKARLVVNLLPKKDRDVENWLEKSPLIQFNTDSLRIDGFDSVQIIIRPEESNDGKGYIYSFIMTSKKQYSLVGTVSDVEKYDSWEKIIIRMQKSFKSIE